MRPGADGRSTALIVDISDNQDGSNLVTIPGGITFDDIEVISGQGTIALEVFEDLPELTDFVVPVGGGGLFTGTGVAFQALAPRVRMHAVEPEGCDSFARSARAGRRRNGAIRRSCGDGRRSGLQALVALRASPACKDISDGRTRPE